MSGTDDTGAEPIEPSALAALARTQISGSESRLTSAGMALVAPMQPRAVQAASRWLASLGSSAMVIRVGINACASGRTPSSVAALKRTIGSHSPRAATSWLVEYPPQSGVNVAAARALATFWAPSSFAGSAFFPVMYNFFRGKAACRT